LALYRADESKVASLGLRRLLGLRGNSHCGRSLQMRDPEQPEHAMQRLLFEVRRARVELAELVQRIRAG